MCYFKGSANLDQIKVFMKLEPETPVDAHWGTGQKMCGGEVYVNCVSYTVLEKYEVTKRE